ncbi:MAG: phenylpyruvate tautomerase MIF-related protein [Lachnospiraceae bacterium]|nr:phenylpyruvate tautomerase MIF-related protein [Lachnospiraceae bacterium]
MPFIDSKITVSVPQEKKDVLKSEFGKLVSVIGKPESFLMVGFEDNYDLYMGGKKLEKGAYVSVSLFGAASRSAYESLTEKICKLFETELGIPGNAVYVTYHGVNDWGWNGRNF